MNCLPIFTSGWKTVLDFLYPSFCFHCGERGDTICTGCSEHLVLLDAGASAQAAAFFHMGPIISLLHAFPAHPHLDLPLASFLVAQITHLNWPFPDVIVPMPQKPADWLIQKFHPPTAIAKALSVLLSRPLKKALKCPPGADFLPDRAPFIWNRAISLTGKTALLIGDTSQPGTQLKAATKTLQQANPDQVYTLTLTQFTD